MSDLHPALCPSCGHGLVKVYETKFFGLFYTGRSWLKCPNGDWQKSIEDIKKDGGLNPPRQPNNQESERGNTGKGNRNEQRRRWKRRQKFKRRQF